jgi:hypothetical protein
VLAFKARAGAVAARTVTHTRGKPAAANAQAASQPDPERDVAGQAAGNRVTSMEGATEEPVPFDAATFKADVRAAVEKIAPPATLDEADRFEESGKAGEAATIARGLVKGGQTATEKPVATSTALPPDKLGLEPKPVGIMVNDPVGRAVTTAGAATVLPAPKPDEAVDLSAGPRSVDEAMTAQGITVPQLAEANEPRFTAALDARQAVADQAAAAVLAYRGEEAVLLPAAAAELGAQEKAGLTAMHTARIGALLDTRGTKGHTRDDDQHRRDDVSQRLLDIHKETKESVEKILHDLDTTVTTMFKEGEEDARYTFEHYVAFKMEEYKNDRYGGLGGGALWLKDKFLDLPDDVNAFYAKGREFYLGKLDRTIDAIAVVIGMSLSLATMVIRIGRIRVQQKLATLSGGLLQLGVETAQQLDQRFDLLASDVSSARDHLVDVVARAYVDANKTLDDRITELQEENKGLATRAIEFAEEVGHTIAELGRLLGRILLKAASVIGSILAHPIRFFGHLVDAIGDGFSLFVKRIGKHLEDALLDLLFGDLGKAGITLPTSLDFAGLFDLVCQVLQIRWEDLRARLVDKIGLPAVLHLEQVADVFRLLVDKGIGGLWELVLKRLSELPDLVIGALKTYVIEQVVRTGIEYIVSLITPASAFIKACQGIYRLLSFIVDKAKQIGDFIEAVLDSMAAIADGDTAAAAEKIDSALAGALKLALGFLAKLAHLDAIAEKARSVIEAIRAPVRRVVDAIIDGAVGLYRSTLGSLGARRTERIPATADARAPPAGTAHAPPVPHPSAHPGAAGPGQLALAHPAPGQPPGTRPSTPVAAQQPADPASITMTEQLSMARAPHTLAFKVIGGQPEVILSSERAEYLQTVTAAAIAEERRGDKKRADLIAFLTDLEKKLGNLYYEYRAAHSKDQREVRHTINGWLEQIAEVLRSIGQNLGIKSLHDLHHPSKYVGAGGKLRDQYAANVRGSFYTGYVSATREWRRDKLAELRVGAPPNHFLDQSTKKFEPLQRPSASGQVRGESNVTIDHQPRVVQHWNGHPDVLPPGRNTGPADRKHIYNDTTPPKLQLVSWRNNSIDGGSSQDDYSKYVGKDFRGPDDEL